MRRIALPGALLTLVSCGGDTNGGGTTPTQPVTPVATTIEVSSSSITLESLSATSTLTAIVKDQNGAAMAGQTVSWASSDDGIATVSNGTVTAVANGSATVTATSGSLSASASVTVSQVAASVTLSQNTASFASLADTTSVTAELLDVGGSVVAEASVTWTSSDEAVAKVADGLITAVANGMATITATSGSLSATLAVTVAQVAAVLTAEEGSIRLTSLGDTVTVSALLTDANGSEILSETLIWSVDDVDVASINAAGRVIARANGATRVLVAAVGLVDSIHVEVDQQAVSLVVTPDSVQFSSLTDTTRLTANTLDEGGASVPNSSWTSSSPTVVTVDSTGLAEAVGNGVATLTASNGAVSDTVTVRVEQIPVALLVSPETVLLTAIADSAKFTASVRDAAGLELQTPPEVLWTVQGDSSVVTISDGWVTALTNGGRRVWATVNDSLTYRTTAYVSQEPASVEVSLDNATIDALGDFTTASLVIRDANGFESSLSYPVNWSAEQPNVATAHSKEARSATVVGLSAGSTSIIATVEDVSGTAAIAVNSAAGSMILTEYYTPDTNGGLIREDGTDGRIGIQGGLPSDWAPDGRVVFTGTTLGRGLWIANPDGSNATLIDGDAGGGRWSPSGDLIAATVYVEPQRVLVVMDTTGTWTRSIEAFGGGLPVWSPDATRIAYASNLGSRVQIMDLATNDTVGVAACQGEPTDWSPDGQYLLCSEWNTVENREEVHLVDLDADPTTSVYLIDGGKGSFSPDGTRVVFERDLNTNYSDLYVIPTAGGSEVQITVTTSDKYWRRPRWFRGR